MARKSRRKACEFELPPPSGDLVNWLESVGVKPKPPAPRKAAPARRPKIRNPAERRWLAEMREEDARARKAGKPGA